MKNTTVVTSARGELVDFELMRIKQEIATTPTVAKREPRRGRRKRLSDRVSKAQSTTTEAPDEEQIEQEVDGDKPTASTQKIVRKNKTGSK
jgi:hypothetical protein